jgi:phage shock protein C
MYCSHCGRQMDPAARFCPACGVVLPVAGYGRVPLPGQLTRPRYPRLIGGVCSGLALHYGWDLSLVRVICALMIVLTGVGLFAYLAAWIIIPEAPYALPEHSGVVSPGAAGSPGPGV